jgi:hypothetical protein
VAREPEKVSSASLPSTDKPENALPLPTFAANTFFGTSPGNIGAVTVRRGYMLRHGNSRPSASDVVGSLQLTCAEAPLHKPR